MRKLEVKLGKRSYPILVGAGILPRLGEHLKKLFPGSDAFIITNAYLKNKYGANLTRVLGGCGLGFHFCLVPDSEKSKSLETAYRVIRKLSAFDRKKKVFIIAFGGGVVGDLSGFVASVYKRGINYVQIPTTLLAQVDSSIGGKTAVDLAAGKNLVGAFYQPRLVLSEINFIQSLSPLQLSSGMAEVIKYALIKDRKLFIYLEKNHKKILAKQPAALEKIILDCSRIKAVIVSRDEKESRGLRTILNFGHTFGHAIEAAAGYCKYNHGQAVALGMLAASGLSRKLGLLGQAEVLRVEKLLRLYGLPVRASCLNENKIIAAHFHDKKFCGKENRFVLLRGLGKAEVVRNVRLDLIKAAIRDLF